MTTETSSAFEFCGSTLPATSDAGEASVDGVDRGVDPGVDRGSREFKVAIGSVGLLLLNAVALNRRDYRRRAPVSVKQTAQLYISCWRGAGEFKIRSDAPAITLINVTEKLRALLV